MTTNRRTFMAGSLAATAATALPMRNALAQQELKLASFVPPTHVIWTDVITPWTRELAKLSNNQLTVRMFPAMQLGGRPPDLYRQVVQGISDITFTLPGYTSGEFPMMALTELPGTAENAADGTRKIWKLFDQYLARDFKDTKVLMLWNSDSASLMSRSKPIRTLEDLKGMRIRTPSAAQSAQLEALGATPVDMPANQIYNNLDRGVIDASMIPMSAALDFKLIEVVKYFTINAPLGRSPFLVAMNRGRYEKLPADLKKVIDTTTGLDAQPQGCADLRPEERRGARGGEEIPRDHLAVGGGAKALDRRVQADDRSAGRGRREGGIAGARAGLSLRVAQLIGRI